MPIPVTCACGRSMRVQDHFAGQEIRCPFCSVLIPIPAPQTQHITVEQPRNLLLDNAPPERPVTVSKPAEEAIKTEPPLLTPPAITPTLSAPKPNQTEWVHEKPPTNLEEQRPSWLENFRNPRTIRGLVLMLVGGVWFFVGWLTHIIWYGSIILFILGLFSFLRGFVWDDE